MCLRVMTLQGGLRSPHVFWKTPQELFETQHIRRLASAESFCEAIRLCIVCRKSCMKWKNILQYNHKDKKNLPTY